MKTPDEIKRGLECCRDSNDMVCPECPYWQQAGCVDAMMTDMVAYIQQLEHRVPRWISVEERLPKANVAVLIRARYCNSYKTHIAEITDEGRWVRDFGKRIAKERISHWMPLPSTEGLHDD